MEQAFPVAPAEVVSTLVIEPRAANCALREDLGAVDPIVVFAMDTALGDVLCCRCARMHTCARGRYLHSTGATVETDCKLCAAGRWAWSVEQAAVAVHVSQAALRVRLKRVCVVWCGLLSTTPLRWCLSGVPDWPVCSLYLRWAHRLTCPRSHHAKKCNVIIETLRIPCNACAHTAV